MHSSLFVLVFMVRLAKLACLISWVGWLTKGFVNFCGLSCTPTDDLKCMLLFFSKRFEAVVAFCPMFFYVRDMVVFILSCTVLPQEEAGGT